MHLLLIQCKYLQNELQRITNVEVLAQKKKKKSLKTKNSCM